MQFLFQVVNVVAFVVILFLQDLNVETVILFNGLIGDSGVDEEN